MHEKILQALKDHHLFRQLRTIEAPRGPVIDVAGKPVLLMASNDYLGLAQEPRVKTAAQEAIIRYGVGSGASRLISGTTGPHMALERALAGFKEVESALTFSCGYSTNLGAIPALIGANGLILADRLSHASLIDGSRLSGADVRFFHHNEMEHLQRLLAKRRPSRPTLIVTEGIFSMDGDAAPLPALVDLAKQYDAALFIDDAHGTGVMGATGRGTLEHYGLESQVPFHMGTLSKALGASGGYIAGQSSVIDYLINKARSFIYSTAPPPSIAAAALAGLQVLTAEVDRRVRLWSSRAYWQQGLTRLGFRTTASISPIIPVILGEAETTVAFSARLLELGVFAPAIRPPTVPKNTSRIRTTVTAAHEQCHLDVALAAFQQVGQELGVIR